MGLVMWGCSGANHCSHLTPPSASHAHRSVSTRAVKLKMFAPLGARVGGGRRAVRKEPVCEVWGEVQEKAVGGARRLADLAGALGGGDDNGRPRYILAHQQAAYI
jgi:hypothetical protein